jgi:hypothetical protein
MRVSWRVQICKHHSSRLKGCRRLADFFFYLARVITHPGGNNDFGASFSATNARCSVWAGRYYRLLGAHIQELGAMNRGTELVQVSAMSTALANGARISASRSVTPSRVISAPQSMAPNKRSKN